MAHLAEPNVSTVNLNNSEIIFKKTYYIAVSSGAFSATLESDSNLTLEPYDSEDYNVSFDSSGTTESLSDQKLTVSGRTVTLSQLSESGSATLTVTWKKKNPKAKNIPVVTSLPGLNQKERIQYRRVQRFSIDQGRYLDAARRRTTVRRCGLVC